jgi:hypothetical protein
MGVGSMNPATLGVGIFAGLALAFVAVATLLMWSAAKAEADDRRRAREERWSG